ncbi:hypothetical protein RJ640_001829 [Escallonia rubra]|uniref:Uncharacterized protein n=1 Tax=Escallonia rubra TaxID=112253 RepID=A0AA88RHJ0_9ASTE|nr:hypothetical protein RJ640_001829 [Escallonia rubra]
MATKNVIVDLVKGEKLNGDNYDVWHKKMKFILNEQELEDHLTKEMVAPTETQPLRDHTAYQKWNQKDRNARYTLLSSLQNDLIGQYDELPTCKALWDQLKFSFGGTSTTRLRSLVIKFEEYTKDPKHTMSEHLRMMSNIMGKLRDAGHVLTDEQQVRAVIRSLPASWASYVMYDEHLNGGRTEIESRDVNFIESDFPRNGDASKNLDLYELEEVEATLPSPSESGELVPHPVVAKDSISDPQPSGSIPDNGSTPLGPLGQQESQLRRAECEISDRQYESDWAEKLSTLFTLNYVMKRILNVATLACTLVSWMMRSRGGMSRKAVGSNWNDMRALGSKFNITPCCVIHSPGNFVDFRFDMSHEYITYERFNTAHYKGFESV